VCDAQVSGFFFLFKKEMFDEIGGFDERFYLHGQDSEWIDRVLESDWDIIIRPDVFVDHWVSASITAAKEREEFSYDMDIFWTQATYDVIRDEKARGVYEPY
jgi:GT2 family glycosyltransferase